MKTGIYGIFLGDKVYVGQSKNIEERKSSHLSHLRNDTHKNTHLQRAFNLHKESVLIFKILEECPVENLTEREQFWIDYYNSANSRFGYNILPAAGSPRGRVWTEEIKNKIGSGNRGKFVSQETRQRISLSKMGHIRSQETIEKHRTQMTGRKADPKDVKARIDSNPFRYMVVSENNNIYATRNLAEFCRSFGLDKSKMVAVAKNKRNHHHKFICRYMTKEEKEKYNPILKDKSWIELSQ